MRNQLLAVLLSVTLTCGFGASRAQAGDQCSSHADCPTSYTCEQGQCRAMTQHGSSRKGGSSMTLVGSVVAVVVLVGLVAFVAYKANQSEEMYGLLPRLDDDPPPPQGGLVLRF